MPYEEVVAVYFKLTPWEELRMDPWMASPWACHPPPRLPSPPSWAWAPATI